MRCLLSLLLGFAACSKGRPDDCAIVRDTPTEAVAKLSQRYPSDPVKVAQVIEACVAPAGDDCERVAKVVAAIPEMAPQISVGKQLDPLDACRALTPALRRCMLPSYVLAHQAECKEQLAAPLREIQIEPRGPGDVTAGCGFVSIFVDKSGTHLATGRSADARCFAPRRSGALDHDWLEAQLRKVKTIQCAPSSAEIAAADELAYEELVATMDFAVKAGFTGTGLSSAGALSVPLATVQPSDTATECPVSVIADDPKDAEPSAPAPRAADARSRLADAPVLVITRDALILKVADASTEIMSIANARKATKLDVLMEMLPPAKDGMLILQADQSTPVVVINRVVADAKSAGYHDVLFAVKNR